MIDRTHLDRETTAAYTLSVTVTDGTNKSEAEDVVININDINDELPVIGAGQEFIIVGEILSGAVVGTVMATDQDFTETVFQNWTITENDTSTDGDSDLPFTIDKSTGVITINDADDINSSQSSLQLVLTVSDGVNVSSAETVIISAEIEVSDQAFLPNLFTPNNDGKNDKFIVRGGRGVQSIKLSVMDRNSNVVFESSDWEELSQQGWDGTSGGKEQPSGAYIWVVRGTSDDGTPFRINGKDTGVIRVSR